MSVNNAMTSVFVPDLFVLISPVQALPPTVESRGEVSRLNTQLSGAFYDAECGLQ